MAAGGAVALAGTGTVIGAPVGWVVGGGIVVGGIIGGGAVAVYQHFFGSKSTEPKGSEANPHETSNAARKDAMRKEGIPTSQQPSAQKKSPAGNTLEYDVPKKGGGTEKKLVQDQKKDKNHGPHWEAGKKKENGQKDPSGRDRLQNGKSKSSYE